MNALSLDKITLDRTGGGSQKAYGVNIIRVKQKFCTLYRYTE